MKVKRIVAAAVLAAGIVAGFPTPAHAGAPGHLYMYYLTQAECQAAGSAGLQNGDWAWWRCFKTSPSGGLWALYVD